MERRNYDESHEELWDESGIKRSKKGFQEYVEFADQYKESFGVHDDVFVRLHLDDSQGNLIIVKPGQEIELIAPYQDDEEQYVREVVYAGNRPEVLDIDRSWMLQRVWVKMTPGSVVEGKERGIISYGNESYEQDFLNEIFICLPEQL